MKAKFNPNDGKPMATNAVEWVSDEIGAMFSQSFGNINVPESSLTNLVQERNELRQENTEQRELLRKAKVYVDKANHRGLKPYCPCDLEKIGSPGKPYSSCTCGLAELQKELEESNAQ